MILTGQEIINQVNEGKIKIFPFSLKQINPNSYNFRLGNIIKYYANHILDPKIKQEAIQIEIPSEGFVLYPDKIYLGHSVEVIGSN